MKRTVLIVESPNDTAFYKNLHAIVLKGKEENALLVDIVEFQDLHNFDYDGTIQRGYSLSSLTKKMETIKRQLDKPNYQQVNHIAIIVDVDFLPKATQKPNREHDGGMGNRLYQVSKAINTVFNTSLDFEELGEGNIAKTSISLDEDTRLDDFYFSCFLTKNAHNVGNLDYLLFDLASKKESAHHANCLFAWADCLKSHNKPIKEGYLSKLWLDYYIRFDTASKEEKSDAEVKLKFTTVMENKGEEIFNFEDSVLIPYKDYFSKILI
jgi:hypothetical protein